MSYDITRAEILQAVEKARAEKGSVSEETRAILNDPIQSLPMRALVEGLYGDDLYDVLPVTLQSFFFDVTRKVVGSVVVAGVLESNEPLVIAEGLGAMADVAGMFDLDHEVKECDCGNPDNRHGLISLLEELASEDATILETFLETCRINQGDYYRVRREVGVV